MINQLLALVTLLIFLSAIPAYTQVLPFGRGSAGGEGGEHQASTHYPGNSADISSVYATRAYADAIASGLNPKHIALVASTANLDLTGEETIDGQLTSASRVLVKDQTNKAQNGLYLSGAGAWTRTTDADTSDEIQAMFVFVQTGTANHDKGFILVTDPPITLGTTDLDYEIFTNPLDITASGGLEKVGNDIRVSDGGISSTKILDGTIVAADVNANAAFLKTQIADSGTFEVSEIPSLPASKITSGELPVERGGTGAANTPTAGRYLKGDGTDFVTSTGEASGTGVCTNEVVTGLNSDAAPNCDPIVDGMIQDGTITNPKLSNTLELPKTKVSDTNPWEVSEIPDLPATKIASGTLDSARLPIATSTAPGALLGDTLCAVGTVQRGRNADGSISCITDETGESATEIVIEETRDPVQGDACELSHKWINQSADPPRWWLPVSCEVGLERWEPTTSEALRDVPGGVAGINEQTGKIDGQFLPWPQSFNTVPPVGGCTSQQQTWIDVSVTDGLRFCGCPGGIGSNPVCRLYVSKIDQVCTGEECEALDPGVDGTIRFESGSVNKFGNVLQISGLGGAGTEADTLDTVYARGDGGITNPTCDRPFRIGPTNGMHKIYCISGGTYVEKVLDGSGNVVSQDYFIDTGLTWTWNANNVPAFRITGATGKITEATIDAEDTNNTITIPGYWDLDLVGVVGGVASHIWNDDPLSTACTPLAVTGTNRTTGVCTFPDSDGDFGRQISRYLPTGWTGSLDAEIIFKTTGTGNARFQMQTKCYADDEADDAAFNTATVVTAAAGTSGRPNKQTVTGITTTGCAAGELMRFRFYRNRTEASDTLNAALDVEKVILKYRVAH